MNGADTLSYLATSGTTITSFNEIPTPAAPTQNANNVGVGAFPITYRVTINSAVGESAASAAMSVTTGVDTDRDNWSGTDNVVINLPSIGAGLSYNVYCGVVAGFEYLIASNISASATTFTDTGGTSMVQDFTRLFPTDNTTAGPRVSRGTNIGGRAFLVGDADNPYNVWWGGDTDYRLDFSPAHGGGVEPVNQGGKELPVAVRLHRDGKGTATIKVYCSGTKGKRFSMTPDQLTFGTTILAFYAVTEDEGESGTNSPDGILYYNNSNWYPSSTGFETEGTLPQLQNVLAGRKVSNSIQPDIASLNQEAMDGVCGMIMDGRLLWALPVNSDSNNEVWTLDIDRKGAWMNPWSFAADWMLQTTDNTGNTHHLVLSNNKLYDLSYSTLTTDDGEPFLTNGQSGQVYFSEDKRMWVQLLMVIIVLSRPQGQINFQITGKTEDSSLQALGDSTLFNATVDVEVGGWGEPDPHIIGWGQFGWSEVGDVPTTTNDATQEVQIEVDEEVQWAAYSWNTTLGGVDYAIGDIIYEYIEVGIKDLQ
jgi:hypothetical protein